MAGFRAVVCLLCGGVEDFSVRVDCTVVNTEGNRDFDLFGQTSDYATSPVAPLGVISVITKSIT